MNIKDEEFIYFNNDVEQTLLNNTKIEDFLHVIIVISNPCNYKRRIQLTKEFIQRMKFYSDVILYIVEMIYDDINTDFTVTDANNPRHLQLKTKTPLWHKENMINLGVKKLLPSSWKAFAWIDADISFDNPNWASDTLKILNGSKDIVQLFSVVSDLNRSGNTMNFFKSFGLQITLKKKYDKFGQEFFHPGYGWAITRSAYEKIGQLYDLAILGSGDFLMSLSLISNGNFGLPPKISNGFLLTLAMFENNSNKLRTGYIPGIINHYYHGSRENRKYGERWEYLTDHEFDPILHLRYIDGILQPNDLFPEGLREKILEYFKDRNEDN